MVFIGLVKLFCDVKITCDYVHHVLQMTLTCLFNFNVKVFSADGQIRLWVGQYFFSFVRKLISCSRIQLYFYDVILFKSMM